MLPDVGGTELLVIAAVALIVVGPKDLPVLLRKVGQWIAKMRSMAAEFRASFDEMARQSELDELRKEVEAMRAGQFAPLPPRPDYSQPESSVTSTLADIQAHMAETGHGLFPPGAAPSLKDTTHEVTGAHTTPSGAPVTGSSITDIAEPVPVQPSSVLSKPRARKPRAVSTVAPGDIEADAKPRRRTPKTLSE